LIADQYNPQVHGGSWPEQKVTAVREPNIWDRLELYQALERREIMTKHNLRKALHLLINAALIAVLTISLVPTQTARAQETSTSDLAVTIVSIPKRVRACEVFEAIFTVTNLGPDPATHLNMIVMLPDPFSLFGLLRAPDSLAVGETVKFSAAIKVTAFVPGEPRLTWIGIDAVSDPYPNVSVDPNAENNGIFKNIRMTGKPVMDCWE
jgi:hypothetical protein